MISGVVSLFVARAQAKATVEAAQATVTAARVTADADLARQCRKAFRRAVQSLQIAGDDAVPWTVRQEQVGRALAGLFEVGAILGPAIRTNDFELLIDALNARTEEGLAQANLLWPRVQQEIVALLAA